MAIVWSVLLAFACAHVSASRAQVTCVEPSSVDRFPRVEPLRVTRGAWSSVHLTWQELTTVDEYQIHRGYLSALPDGHQLVALSADAEERVATWQSQYFLVVSRCGAELSSAGRDSESAERPVFEVELVHVVIRVTGTGEGIGGLQLSLDYPSSGVAFFEGEQLGSFVDADTAINAGRPFRLGGFFSPDGPHPTMVPAEDVYFATFTFVGAAPREQDFHLVCLGTDTSGEELDIGCEISDFFVAP